MPVRKRKAPSKGNPRSPSKRARKSTAVSSEIVVLDDGSEDDLESILARINEQEESERLAKALHDEWNQASGSLGPHGSGGAADLEDDEALARRLAKEWEQTTNLPNNSGNSGREEQPPDKILSDYRNTFICSRECTKCGKLVRSPRGFVMFTDDSLPPSLTMLMHAPCFSCRTNHCRGCFVPVSCSTSCKGLSKSKTCSISACCAEGRAIAIFETLGAFDRQYITEYTTSHSRPLATRSKDKASTEGSVGPGGTGYGTGVRTDCIGSNISQASAPAELSEVQQAAARWDENTVRALRILTSLLPSPYAEDARDYDLIPHTTIGPLLGLSKLPELLAGLLRNDSVTDWIARSDIYHAMLSLLRRLADCELTVQVLIQPRWEAVKTPGLEKWMWKDGEITWEKGHLGGIGRAPPLYDYFRRLTRQCEAFLAGASQLVGSAEGTGDTEETLIQATSLCGDIIATKGDMERIMCILGYSPHLEAPRSSSQEPISSKKNERTTEGKKKPDIDQIYSSSCEKRSFGYITLAVPGDQKGKNLNYSHYSYNQNLNQTQAATRPQKYRFHLVQELAIMATSLPPGIWVRADEVRNDAIKIMIAGPQGTPYEGGLFEFDCFMPPEYPLTPPLMHLRTTGGGTVRFNPNLYNSGKVCLSLLGTWPGRPEEAWTSKSTLLQVLVSIQSMIFIDAPYFNEPGYGQVNLKAPASISYNHDVSLNTTRWGIVEWLKSEHQGGIWRDVITSHFNILQDRIREKIVEWAGNDSRIRSKERDLLQEYDQGIALMRSWSS